MSAWPFVKLESIAEFKNGLNFSKKNWGVGLKIIGVSDFQDYFYPHYETVEQINPNGVVRDADYLEEDDILFVRSNGNRDLIGRSLFIKHLPERMSHSGFTIRARFKSKENVFPLFYAYVFKSSLIRCVLSIFGGGTNINNLNQQILKQLAIPLPSFQTQCKIAAILSTYDELIENNKRRIALLEKTAEEIYREWFVRFRFPGHGTSKFSKGVPADWQALPVGDLVKRIPPGKLYEQKTAAAHGRVPILDQGQSGVIGYHDNEPGVFASFETPIIVFANHTCYQRLIFFPFSAIQNVLPFVTSEIYKSNIYWLHFATNRIIEFSEYKGHWPAFVSTQVYYPGFQLTQLYGNIAEPIIKHKFHLEEMNKVLRKTRDIFLPRLISGKLLVENLDIQFPQGIAEELKPEAAELEHA